MSEKPQPTITDSEMSPRTVINVAGLAAIGLLGGYLFRETTSQYLHGWSTVLACLMATAGVISGAIYGIKHYDHSGN